jgi:hypothetical protein
MKSASQATYLGDVISENGKVDETVLQRTQKATGIANQISSMFLVSAWEASITILHLF